MLSIDQRRNGSSVAPKHDSDFFYLFPIYGTDWIPRLELTDNATISTEDRSGNSDWEVVKKPDGRKMTQGRKKCAQR